MAQGRRNSLKNLVFLVFNEKMKNLKSQNFRFIRKTFKIQILDF